MNYGMKYSGTTSDATINENENENNENSDKTNEDAFDPFYCSSIVHQPSEIERPRLEFDEILEGSLRTSMFDRDLSKNRIESSSQPQSSLSEQPLDRQRV